MGDRNQTYLSQEWTGADGKQIARKNGSCDAQCRASTPRGIFVGVRWSPPFAGLTLVMYRSGGFDSSKRAGIRCQRMWILIRTQRRRNGTWQVMH
jgi:hypothetical protein